MSESPALSRSLGGADGFERRMRSGGQSPAPESPLAELARLVGQEDPFRARVPERALERSAHERRAAASAAEFDRHDHAYAGGFTAPDEPGLPDEAAVVHGNVGQPPVLPPRPGTPSLPIETRRAPEPSADAWAQGHTGEPYRGDDDLVASRDQPVREAGENSSRRTLVVLAAVVVLTAGGLAASFMARPGQSVAASSSATAPTILAATGPSKVQPEVTPTDADAPSQSSTLLDKNKGDGTATAKVVDTVEQPVDLTKAVKPSAAPADDTRAVSPSGFPEPRKVRTVTVRPDGTIVATASAPVADSVTAALGQPSDLAFDPKMSVPPTTPDQPVATPAQTPAAVAPATQKSRVRASTTPVSADAVPSGSIPSDAQAVTPTAKVKTPKPKPAQVATTEAPAAEDAGAAPAGAGGAFAVQLGAPGTEAEAQDVSSRLVKKYAAQLGSYRPAIHKADVGSKSVYRIRIGGLSQDDAKTLCTSLKAAGGGCFVVHN